MQVVAAHRLGQADLSGQRAGVGHLGAVEGDEPAPLCPVAVGGVIDADDDHLVVGEQVTLDRLSEPEPVEHRAELCLVVHRGDLEVGLFGFPHDPTGEVARGGRHEQPAACLDLLAVEDGGEVGGDAPGAAMGLIGDDQVEGRHPTQPERLGDLRRRLVGGKHDTRAGPPAQERSDLLGVGRDREAQITGVRTTASGSATVSSEHTGRKSNPTLVLAVHSRSVWANSDSDGTSTSVRSAASFSWMNNAARVLPVPQAMIIWPRSCESKPFTTALIAWR